MASPTLIQSHPRIKPGRFDDETERVPQKKKYALVTSGGGLRAFIESAAFTKSVTEKGLIDHSSYFVSLSGSCWFLSTFLASGKTIQEYCQTLVNHGYNIRHIDAETIHNILHLLNPNQIAHIYGDQLKVISQVFVPQDGTNHLQYKEGFPYPLFTAIDAPKDSASWYEFSPLEFSKCGDDKDFKISLMSWGNDMNILMAIWGSAFCGNLKQLADPLPDISLIPGTLLELNGEKTFLMDAGIDFNIPLKPLLTREDKFDEIIIYDSTQYPDVDKHNQYLRKQFAEEFDIHLPPTVNFTHPTTIPVIVHNAKMRLPSHFGPGEKETHLIHYIPAHHNIHRFPTARLHYSHNDVKELFDENVKHALQCLESLKIVPKH